MNVGAGCNQNIFCEQALQHQAHRGQLADICKLSKTFIQKMYKKNLFKVNLILQNL